jgi:hypothetical protein
MLESMNRRSNIHWDATQTVPSERQLSWGRTPAYLCAHCELEAMKFVQRAQRSD